MHQLFYKYKQSFCIVAIIGLLFSFSSNVSAQRSPHFEAFIDRWYRVAIDHQQRYGIPASIKLAQAILESGAGTSYLARNANNYFGIKCHDWTGRTIIRPDDTPYCCFRVYNNAMESWNDHSIFLTTRAHYRFLFDLDITDYRGWARGLLRAGYATNPNYANQLISIIERYSLYRFDRMQPDGSITTGRRLRIVPQRNGAQQTAVRTNQQASRDTWTHQPYITHGLLHIIARDGDTYSNIARAFGLRERDLLRFNDKPADMALRAGDIVYFERKRTRAQLPHTHHTVRAGETMHSISQQYGIQLNSLFRMNRMRHSDVPREGEVLRLR